MNHYFTINYSFLSPEKVLCYIKSNNFPYQYFENITFLPSTFDKNTKNILQIPWPLLLKQFNGVISKTAVCKYMQAS